MKRSLGFIIIGATVLATNASAVLINFDDGQPNLTPIGSFYSGVGVTFTNAQWKTSSGLLGTSGSQSINSISDASKTQQSNPIVATFAFEVSSVTLRGIDVGNAGFRLKAFDGSDVLIDNQVAFGTTGGFNQFFDLTVAGAIRRIEFSQDQSTSDTSFYDNLSFTPAPVPEPMTMAALTMGCLALLRRKKSR